MKIPCNQGYRNAYGRIECRANESQLCLFQRYCAQEHEWQLSQGFESCERRIGLMADERQEFLNEEVQIMENTDKAIEEIAIEQVVEPIVEQTIEPIAEPVVQEQKYKGSSKRYRDKHKNETKNSIPVAQPKHERHYPHGHFKVHLKLSNNQVIVPYNDGYATLVGDFSHVKAGDEIDY